LRIVARTEPDGVLLFDPESVILVELTKTEAATLGYGGPFPDDVPAPRLLHIEITSRCNLSCDNCYVKPTSEEMSGEEIKRVLGEAAAMRVFQVALGGGEPFLREDIFDIARHAVSLGLVVTATTNGTVIKDDSRLALFKQINVSYHGDLGVLERALDIIQRHTKAGVNFTMSVGEVGALDDVVSICRKRDIELLLMTLKPVDGNVEDQINPGQVMRMAENLSRTGLKVAVDGLTCSRCLAAQHFVDLDASGNIYACSFIRRPMGNVRTDSLENIWKRRASFVPNHCPYLPTSIWTVRDQRQKSLACDGMGFLEAI
jgi:MoaA/NifB/PqqE/SkfB family radical SAM enzyme